MILAVNKDSVQSSLQTVEAGDLKPLPVLWHEDNGRRPHDNSNRFFITLLVFLFNVSVG
jgi:hypothetical protein